MRPEQGLRLPPDSPAGRLKAKLADSWLHPLHLARHALARALAEVAPLAAGRMLDIGCGRKPYSFPAVSRHFGLDLPANSAGGGSVDVYADAGRLPFAAATFDSVLCTEVLEHVPEPGRVLAEAARLLRPNAVLLLTTPQTWGLHEAPHDYYRYTEYRLRYLAGQAGLRVASVRPTCGVWATVGQRLSSFLFYSLSARWPLAARGAVAALCAPLQLAAWGLDILFRHAGDPLDHLLVAEKP